MTSEKIRISFKREEIYSDQKSSGQNYLSRVGRPSATGGVVGVVGADIFLRGGGL